MEIPQIFKSGHGPQWFQVIEAVTLAAIEFHLELKDELADFLSGCFVSPLERIADYVARDDDEKQCKADLTGLAKFSSVAESCFASLFSSQHGNRPWSDMLFIPSCYAGIAF
ncbi:MAG: hypothetical protein JWM11_7247 [Planctomycetaceae bacterium]|nr:hypothetical protein [Planctomycetaceae bacterium]